MDIYFAIPILYACALIILLLVVLRVKIRRNLIALIFPEEKKESLQSILEKERLRHIENQDQS